MRRRNCVDGDVMFPIIELAQLCQVKFMIHGRKRRPHKPCKPIYDSDDLKRVLSTAAYRHLFWRGFLDEFWSNSVFTTAGLRAVYALRTSSTSTKPTAGRATSPHGAISSVWSMRNLYGAKVCAT